MAQDLTVVGYGLAEMQNAGRWQSPDIPGRYSRGQAAGIEAEIIHRGLMAVLVSRNSMF